MNGEEPWKNHKIKWLVRGRKNSMQSCVIRLANGRGLVDRGENPVFASITTPPFCVTGNNVPAWDRTSLEARMIGAKISKCNEEPAVGIKNVLFPFV